MNKVTTINLNGRAYQLEEQGFDALRKYLETAAAKLEGNPDKDEIMADFEQAIADKCDQKLAGHKNVISAREIEDIIAAMGPVEANEEMGGANGSSNSTTSNAANNGTSGASGSTASTPKRLFRIPQGEWIMGVCRGLGAYFNIDVTLVRIIFILLTIFSHGFWILAYIVLAVVMPVAKTDEEVAQAHGWSPTPPFNAHDFIEQAKARYGQLHDELQKMHDEHKAKNYGSSGSTMNMDAAQSNAAAGAAGDAADIADAAKAAGQKTKEDAQKWKHNFKQEMRQKKEQMKQEWRAQQRARHDRDSYYDSQRYAAQDHNPGWIVAQVFLGIFSVIISVAIAALAAAWAFAIISLVKHGTILGYALGAGHPLWISIVFLTAALYIIVTPFASLLHNAWGMSYYRDSRHRGSGSFGRVFFFLVMLVILFFSARELFPQVGVWWNTAVAWLNTRV